MPGSARADVDQAIGAVWRIESARIVAGVARLVRDIGLAEELAGDALVAALDRLRRDKAFQQKLQQIGLDLEAQEALMVPDFVSGLVDQLDVERRAVIGDDLLRLIFTACHPVRGPGSLAARRGATSCKLERASASRAQCPILVRPAASAALFKHNKEIG